MGYSVYYIMITLKKHNKSQIINDEPDDEDNN